MRLAPSHGFSKGCEPTAGPVPPGSCRRSGEGRVMSGTRPSGPADRSSRYVRILWAGLLIVLAARPATAQGPLRGSANFKPDDSGEAVDQLRNAANHARDRQWSETADLYQRVIDRYAGKVVKVPRDEPGGSPADVCVLYLDARGYCHRMIARLPAEARAIYRSRTDQLAGRWYREGAAARDPRLLRRIVDQAFCSSWGDDALELLGDLAFQDGRFAEAQSFYGHLVPDRPDDSSSLIHPDPSVDLARVDAKQLAVPDGAGAATGPGGFAGLYHGTSWGQGVAGRPHGRLCPDPGAGGGGGPAGDSGRARWPLADLRGLGRDAPGSSPVRSTSARCSGGWRSRKLRRRGRAGIGSRRWGRLRRHCGRSSCWRITRSCWATRW